MEYVIFAVVMLGILLLLMGKGYLDYKQEEKNFIKRLHTEYGKLSEKEYKEGRLSNIARYFEKHREGFFLDQITWNDLNMDEVFRKMNGTMSAAGEEYLYYLLRTPALEEQTLKEREDKISYFQTHEKERVECQFLFHKLGSMNKYSIYNYLDYLEQLEQKSNLPHYLALAMVLFSVVMLFVHLPIGLVFLSCVFVFNILSYFKVKNEIDPYITSFGYIFRLLAMAEQLTKVKIPLLQKEWQRLGVLSAHMNGFKRGSFLLMSQGRMSGSGNPLELALDYLRMLLHLDLIQFNKMLAAVRAHIGDIDEMLTITGSVDAFIAIGAYRASLPHYCLPEFQQDKALQVRAMYHPLLTEPVKNDMDTRRGVLITGSNASGKSTFLKTMALNSILAQTIHTVLAVSYRGTLFRICSSMSLRDDIGGGDSYYMVEIKALKRILDEMHREGPVVLCFVDEVLRGTNTVERIAASVQILHSLSEGNCLCFAATHDIELTHLLEKEYDNYHFEEEIENNDIFFSYKIMEGRARTRNAIKLLGIMGYDEEIVQKAEELAASFQVLDERFAQ